LGGERFNWRLLSAGGGRGVNASGRGLSPRRMACSLMDKPGGKIGIRHWRKMSREVDLGGARGSEYSAPAATNGFSKASEGVRSNWGGVRVKGSGEGSLKK